MSGFTLDITGTSEVLANLNRAIAGIQGRTKEGVGQAGLLVQGRAQEKTPVDTGVLRSGAGTAVEDGSSGPTATVYYQADYAPYVHENTEAHHPVGEAGFLLHAVDESQSDVLAVIASTAKVP